jgi:hypothetical protein
MRTIAQTLVVDEATREVVRRLHTQGLPHLLLKGPSVARWLYEEGPPRTYVDCDLLVAPASVTRVEECLRDLGFERPVEHPAEDLPGDRPNYVFLWERPSDKVVVELHKTLLGIGVTPEEFWDLMWPRRTVLDLDGVDVDVLDQVGLAFHVALHAAQDGERVGKPLDDLRRALAIASLGTWEAAANLATEADALPAFTAGLEMIAEGEEMKRRLGLTTKTSPYRAIRTSTAPEEAKAGALALEWFGSIKGWRARATWALHKLAPSPIFMRAWSPLARRSGFGLAVAYVYRPVWLVKRTVQGAWLWVRLASKKKSDPR